MTMGLREVRANSRKARRGQSRAGRSGLRAILFRERIDALTVFAFGRYDRQVHLLSQSAADEPADAVGLPTSGLHDLGERDAFLPAHKFQDDRFLRVVAWNLGLIWLGGLLARRLDQLLRVGFFGGSFGFGRALP